MDQTFNIKKSTRKVDFLNFLGGARAQQVDVVEKNCYIVAGTPIFAIFGKTYIRVQDYRENPKKITQFFYDVSLTLDKYNKKIDDIIKSSKERIEKMEKMAAIKESLVSLLTDFVVNNKYTYEPYTLDTSELLDILDGAFHSGDTNYIGTISSENNFSIKISIDNEGKLFYNPKMDYRITSDLSPDSVSETNEYITIVDTIIKKIDKLKKVMALIINDLNLASKVNE